MSDFHFAQVRVEGGVLWVGGEAYPLRNISHVGERVLQPPVSRVAAWTRFIIGTLICLVIWAILNELSTPFGLVVLLGVMALLVWRLVSALKLRTIYGLIINTSGVQHDAVWSSSESEIVDLVRRITEAIGHPDDTQWVHIVNQYVKGDVVNQYGSGNVGKQQVYSR